MLSSYNNQHHRDFGWQLLCPFLLNIASCFSASVCFSNLPQNCTQHIMHSWPLHIEWSHSTGSLASSSSFNLAILTSIVIWKSCYLREQPTWTTFPKEANPHLKFAINLYAFIQNAYSSLYLEYTSSGALSVSLLLCRQHMYSFHSKAE